MALQASTTRPRPHGRRKPIRLPAASEFQSLLSPSYFPKHKFDHGASMEESSSRHGSRSEGAASPLEFSTWISRLEYSGWSSVVPMYSQYGDFGHAMMEKCIACADGGHRGNPRSSSCRRSFQPIPWMRVDGYACQW